MTFDLHSAGDLTLRLHKVKPRESTTSRKRSWRATWMTGMGSAAGTAVV